MNTVWFPTPIVVLLRRVANVVSGLSISHHYLRHRSEIGSDSAKDDTRKTPWATFRWPSRSNDTRQFSQSAANQAVEENPSNGTPSPGQATRVQEDYNQDEIHRLIQSPVLYDPVRRPRYPIALCHGLYGFDVRGPSSFPILQMHYWTNTLNILRQTVGAEVIVTSVPSTGSIASRAESMDRYLRQKAPGRGINFMAHSMGGLDCRHLITHLKPTEYTPLSLTSIATPHRGSPFMDWCKENLGLGRMRKRDEVLAAAESMAHEDPHAAGTGQQTKTPDTPSKKSETSSIPLSLTSLPSSFTTLLLSILDSPAYANLTSTYLNTVFNPQTPDDPRVKYFSVAGRVSSLSVWHPLWLPKMVLDGFEERERDRFRNEGNSLHLDDDQWGSDALVTVQSARWGQFLGILEGCDHWDLRGARGIDVDLPSVSISGLSIPGIGSSNKGTRESEAEDSSSSSYGWSLGDWTRFVRAWKREERDAARSAGAGISERESRESDEQKQKRAHQEADEAVKSSTDKMSAVFDWIADQVPSRALDILPSTSSVDVRPEAAPEHARKPERERTKKTAEHSELATKKDLERFYVALCKKLYDEGL